MQTDTQAKRKPISELTLVELDYWVARACGYGVGYTESNPPRTGGVQVSIPGGTIGHTISGQGVWIRDYKPTKDWSHCGPLIERFRVNIEHHPYTSYEAEFRDCWATCEAAIYDDDYKIMARGEHESTSDKPDPKIAICRAVVSLKWPEGVEDGNP